MQAYTDAHPLLCFTPLNPRDAFYGGRTGHTYAYYKTKKCEYGKFPVGHPKVYIGDECSKLSLTDIEGLIKCKILPSRHIYHPVLPSKMNDKLMFVLCRSCGEQFSLFTCTHTQTERALVGTWTADEVRKALEKGYTILEMYEVWHYDHIEQYDKVGKKGGLFTELMNTFIKIKQQASGWPKNCETNKEKLDYTEKFFEMEDVRLHFSEIMENPGLRSLSKLILNSFWGKFGEKENQTRTLVVNEPKELYDLLSDPAIYINTIIPINEYTLIVNWEHRTEAFDVNSKVNVVIASYVTAQARLKLYSYLDQLEDRVLYYDTDSVIYISRPGELDIITGQCIGDMTDELESYGVGSYITEFVSGGPKNYTYKLFSPKTSQEYIICKIKGITLNYNTSKIINFESIKQQVLEPSESLYV